MTQNHPFGRVLPLNKAWLAKLPAEEALQPELPIVDTHHHMWAQLPAALPQGDSAEDHVYLLDAYKQDLTSGHHTVATVYMECHASYRSDGPEEMRPVGETEFAAAQGEASDAAQAAASEAASDATSSSASPGGPRVCQGIIGAADLKLGARVRPVLEAHLQAGLGRFRGVRASAAYDPAPDMGNTISVPGSYARDDFRAGVRELTAMGLSFDAWVFHTQLPEVTALARACPDTAIVMGHCGGPLGYGPYAGRRDEVFVQWKRSLTELAACPNVNIKLGGMMIRLAAIDYATLPAPPSSLEIARLWGPYINTCIELFGPQRCMFESNFPVEKLGASWVTLWNAFKRITAGASASEQALMFSGTAQRVYRL